MRRFILTGAPGAGKTTLLRSLAEQGYSVVEEAATDVIAREQAKGIPEPWTDASFIQMILTLQKQRQAQALSTPVDVQFFDRVPLDTYALCKYLGEYFDFPLSPELFEEFQEAQNAGDFERDVFFIENLGFCEPTAARRITYEETLHFEKIHEEVYREWGYRCLKIPPVSVPERVSMILAHIAHGGREE